MITLILSMTGFTLALLKLLGGIDWPWWVITLPYLIGLVIFPIFCRVGDYLLGRPIKKRGDARVEEDYDHDPIEEPEDTEEEE